MGCQSVTGKGLGSAERTAKGPKERNFVGVEKLIGPRVVLAAQVTLSGGAATYTFPVALSGIADYCVAASAEHAVTVTKNVDGDGQFTGVDLAGTGTDVVDVMVVKVGL
jgi:hypothetical protein